MEKITQSISLLGEKSTSVEDLVKLLGHITHQNQQEVFLQPEDNQFSQVTLVLDENGEVFYVDFILKEAFPLKKLEAEFGSSKKMPALPSGKEVRRVVKVKKKSAIFAVSLIASINNDLVYRLILRRD